MVNTPPSFTNPAARKTVPLPRHPIEVLISVSVFALLAAFTYAFFVQIPYSGFYFNPGDGRVLEIYVNASPAAALHVGDILKQIGTIPWSSYKANARQPIFENIQPGQAVNIAVLRNGEPQTIPWVFPGFNNSEFRARLFNIWWLAYFFWLFGAAIQLFMRPKDARWRLLIAANYLTGFWIMLGSQSTWQIWGSSVLLHAVTWLALPVYLNLHWIFPKPLGRVPKFAWGILYLVCGLLAAGEILQLLPRWLYYFGFLLIFGGSVGLLIAHFAKQPAQRREVGLLATFILIAVIPSIILGIVKILGANPLSAPQALLALLTIPGAYFYGVYRRQLGGLELRANRIVTLFLYGILVLSISIPLTLVIDRFSNDLGMMLTIGLLLTLLLCLASAILYPYFQLWAERRILGILLPPARMLELYSARIVTSMEIVQLKRVICDEVLPSLLIRQMALLRLEESRTITLVCGSGINDSFLPQPNEIPTLLAQSGRIRQPPPVEEASLPCPWAHLILTLSLEGKPVGLCLFGRRDPDDFYSATEIPTLQALMDQTALALMNIEQAERLLALYKADIEWQEVERNRLALELHDDVLGQMALLKMNMSDITASPRFDQAYQTVTERIRQIVNGLRPTMLSYGLRPSLDELADETPPAGSNISVKIDVPSSEIRYPLMVELHVFRIIQQAFHNALQHACAKTIRITGKLEPDLVDLVVEDDGIGFATGERLDLIGLLANKHFGLAGMHERAALIGAEMTIESCPGMGTHVRVLWAQGAAHTEEISTHTELPESEQAG